MLRAEGAKPEPRWFMVKYEMDERGPHRDLQLLKKGEVQQPCFSKFPWMDSRRTALQTIYLLNSNDDDVLVISGSGI